MDFNIPLAPDAQGFSVEIDGVTYRTLRRNDSDEILVAVTSPYTPTSVGAAQLVVPTAGTRVQLPNQACKAVSIAAIPWNTGYIYLGNVTVATAVSRVLAAGEAIDIAIDNLNRLYIDASISTEGISYLWVS